MIVEYSKDFDKQLAKFKDATIAKRVKVVIEKFEEANALQEISNIKAISGWEGYYRVSFGVYRIGFFLTDENTVEFLAIAHRSNIYRIFP
jgi:mRNA-degrading endonuclease RelE of RelBE toxin-antitoxin system